MIRILLKTSGRPDKGMISRAELLAIGRAPSNTIVLNDRHVSWQHGRIVFRDGRYWYRDLHSTNGSLLKRGSKRASLRGQDFDQLLTVGDVIILGSEENAIEICEIVDDIVIGGDFGKTVIMAEPIDPKGLEESLADDVQALRAVVRLARGLGELRDVASVKHCIAEATHEVLAPVHRSVVFDCRNDDFLPVALVPASVDRSPEAIAKSVTLLAKVVNENRGLVYVVYEDSIRAVASQIQNLDMRDSARLFTNQAILCCPLVYGQECYGVIQVESGSCAELEQAFSQRDLALTTMMAHLTAARLHDLGHHEKQLKIQRKANVGMITSWICHDLRNLLQLPLSLASMIPILLKNDPENQLERILVRNRACIEVMNVILHDITDVAKDAMAQVRECDLVTELRETVHYLQLINPEHLEVEAQWAVPIPRVVCNPAGIQRLVLNLALNAADAIAEGDRKDEGKIAVTCRYLQDEGEMMIEIQDNGPGIPDDVLSEMKIMYERILDSEGGLRDVEDLAERSKSRKLRKGKGLGFLFVCQTVAFHKGRMDIATGPNGTTFTIRLPREGPHSIPQKTAAEKSTAEHSVTQRVEIDPSSIQ